MQRVYRKYNICPGFIVKILWGGDFDQDLRKLSAKSCSNFTMVLSTYYTQYIKKRNRYIFADNLSNFKDLHFKLAGYIDLYVYH